MSISGIYALSKRSTKNGLGDERFSMWEGRYILEIGKVLYGKVEFCIK